MKNLPKLVNLFFFLISAIVLSSGSSATTLQFETIQSGVSFGQSSLYSESGYVLQNLAPSFWAIASPNNGFGSLLGPVSTSDFFSAQSGTNVILGGPSVFSLSSIDLGVGMSAPLNPQVNTAYIFQGVTDSSTTVNFSYTLTDNAWHTLSFTGNPDFQHLTNLSIRLVSTDPNLVSMSLDNITVSTVPLPEGFYLMGSALLSIVSGIACKKVNRIE